MSVAWKLSGMSDVQLVNFMLECAMKALPLGAHSIVQSTQTVDAAIAGLDG